MYTLFVILYYITLLAMAPIIHSTGVPQYTTNIRPIPKHALNKTKMQ